MGFSLLSFHERGRPNFSMCARRSRPLQASRETRLRSKNRGTLFFFPFFFFSSSLLSVLFWDYRSASKEPGPGPLRAEAMSN